MSDDFMKPNRGLPRVKLPEKPQETDGPAAVRDYLSLMLMIQYNFPLSQALRISNSWRAGTYKRMLGMDVHEFERLFDKQDRAWAAELYQGVQDHAQNTLEPRIWSHRRRINMTKFWIVMIVCTIGWITCVRKYGPNWFDKYYNYFATFSLFIQAMHVVELSDKNEIPFYIGVFVVHLYLFLDISFLLFIQTIINSWRQSATAALTECSMSVADGQYTDPCSFPSVFMHNIRRILAG